MCVSLQYSKNCVLTQSNGFPHSFHGLGRFRLGRSSSRFQYSLHLTVSQRRPLIAHRPDERHVRLEEALLRIAVRHAFTVLLR